MAKRLIKGGKIYCACGEYVGEIGEVEAEGLEIEVLHPEHTWSLHVFGMTMWGLYECGAIKPFGEVTEIEEQDAQEPSL